MAEVANQKGNNFYREARYIQAQKCFQEATELNVEEPKYPSNLSAVLYELGFYPECILVIYIAWMRLRAQNKIDGNPSTPSQSDPLAIKLATRFAKANINGVASNVISTHIKSDSEDKYAEYRADIEKITILEREDSADQKVQIMKAAWDQWRGLLDRCARHSDTECSSLAADAKKRLRAIHIFKSSMDPTMEYFRFGHDPVQSLMYGVNGQPDDPFSLDSPQYRNQDRWTFLFGGAGDARHVFGTLIHLAQIANESSILRQQDVLSVHMTLIDIHPATLTRVIVIFALIHRILLARSNNDNVRKVELHATLFYLYTTMLMPAYCRQIIIDICKDLLETISNGTYSLSKCLHINEKSLPTILDFLRYWSAPLPKSTKILIERNRMTESHPFQGPDMDNLLNDSLRKNLPTQKAAKGPYNDPDVELKIYKRIRVLLPPKSLLSRHAALANLVKSYYSASDAKYVAAFSEVQNTWYPNPTLFDQFSEKPQIDMGGTYPNVSNNPFETLASFSDITKEFQKGPPVFSSSGNSGFVASSRFFEMFADAVWELQNTLKIELVIGDVIMGLPKLFSGDLGKRPEEFPKKYSRMFLSNVPDYTHGVLNSAVHLVQHLEPEALVIANCLLNAGAFRNISDFCYNYTLLLPQDLPRYLGCKILNPQRLAFDDIALQAVPLPCPLADLASKKELHTWLAHLFLCTLCNGTPRLPPMRIDLPNNLNAFLLVLVHLHRVGFPSHWISDFLQSVVSNNLITDVQPYLGRTPVPSTEARNRRSSRKVHLEAWQADVQVMLASTMLALPFTVTLPRDYPTFGEIRTFKANVRPLNLSWHPMAQQWGPLISGITKTAGLLFYKPSEGVNADFLARRVPALLEGASEIRDVQVQIMLCQESVDLDVENEISWKLSQSWYDKMKQEGWSMAAYRTDLSVSATAPVAASEWLQIS